MKVVRPVVARRVLWVLCLGVGGTGCGDPSLPREVAAQGDDLYDLENDLYDEEVRAQDKEAELEGALAEEQRRGDETAARLELIELRLVEAEWERSQQAASVVALSDDVAALGQRVAALEASLAYAAERVEVLESTYSFMAQRDSDLENELLVAAANVADLTAGQAALVEDLATQTASLAALDTEVAGQLAAHAARQQGLADAVLDLVDDGLVAFDGAEPDQAVRLGPVHGVGADSVAYLDEATGTVVELFANAPTGPSLTGQASFLSFDDAGCTGAPSQPVLAQPNPGAASLGVLDQATGTVFVRGPGAPALRSLQSRRGLEPGALCEPVVLDAEVVDYVPATTWAGFVPGARVERATRDPL